MSAAPPRTPRVSVIVPAYNAARYLERAVRSALEDQGASVEVIVIDDASGDETAEIAGALARRDSRVRLLRNEANLGPGASRNRGMAAARGEWIALLDADDAFAPGRLARLTAVGDEAGLDMIADLPLLYDLAADRPAPTQIPADGRLEHVDARAFLEASVRPDAPIDYGLLQPLTRARLAREGTFRFAENTRHGEDFLAVWNALCAGARMGVLHERGYVFSTRIGGLSGAFSPGSVTDVNYRSVAASTRRIIDEIRARGADIPGLPAPEAEALLRQRLRKCAELNARYGWTTLRKGAWRRHWRWLRQDWRNPPLLALVAARRLARRAARALARQRGRSPG
ncbi:glycosyltransferase family 2 protein [Oceanicella actignis]|uniref:Succinoglycan biosynthesis protein ExoO n=1 Tax=Oceanicella actignis TaxID=1189325 RepID=A0A1M7T4P2_9RHOB|nr:glycosyltransferase family 2 protein [Oceanicella actignis]SET41764.1 succinoglycan biosynthesis protein ExoO [Oceanicella actignis]SHN65651.1 succinoglycan biosynthesis protein ExoO [Oceanicella actignis]